MTVDRIGSHHPDAPVFGLPFCPRGDSLPATFGRSPPRTPTPERSIPRSDPRARYGLGMLCCDRHAMRALAFVRVPIDSTHDVRWQ